VREKGQRGQQSGAASETVLSQQLDLMSSLSVVSCPYTAISSTHIVLQPIDLLGVPLRRAVLARNLLPAQNAGRRLPPRRPDPWTSVRRILLVRAAPHLRRGPRLTGHRALRCLGRGGGLGRPVSPPRRRRLARRSANPCRGSRPPRDGRRLARQLPRRPRPSRARRARRGGGEGRHGAPRVRCRWLLGVEAAAGRPSREGWRGCSRARWLAHGSLIRSPGCDGASCTSPSEQTRQARLREVGTRAPGNVYLCFRFQCIWNCGMAGRGERYGALRRSLWMRGRADGPTQCTLSSRQVARRMEHPCRPRVMVLALALGSTINRSDVATYLGSYIKFKMSEAFL
jgi:hypothetical protein